MSSQTMEIKADIPSAEEVLMAMEAVLIARGLDAPSIVVGLESKIISSLEAAIPGIGSHITIRPGNIDMKSGDFTVALDREGYHLMKQNEETFHSTISKVNSDMFG